MTDPVPPPVPRLSSEWIAARRADLVSELVVARRRRPYTRLAVGGLGAVCAIAAVIVALVLTLSGPAAQSAFAGWSATPTQAPSAQTAAAESTCAANGLGFGSNGQGPATPERGAAAESSPPSWPTISADEWQTKLTDTRGPFTMVILEADEGHAITSCLVGPGNHIHGYHGPMVSANGSFEPEEATPVPADQVQVWYENVDRVAEPPYTMPGAPYTRIEGHTGAAVTGVTVVLEDGTHVQATSSNGWFLAWWPGSQQAVSAEVSTSSGVSTQQLSREGASEQAPES